jgi:hypothetical protein
MGAFHRHQKCTRNPKKRKSDLEASELSRPGSSLQDSLFTAHCLKKDIFLHLFLLETSYATNSTFTTSEANSYIADFQRQ